MFVSRDTIGSNINNGGIDEPNKTINDNGSLLITFVDFNHSNSLSTMIYENGTWSNIGPAGFTNGVGSDCSIASHDNTPYVLYKDTTATNKASVGYYYIEPETPEAVENYTKNNNLTIYPILQEKQQLNISNLSNGICLITYENDSLKQSQRLFIQK